MTPYLEAVIHTAVVLTVIFCGLLFLILRKYGRPTTRHDGFLNVIKTDTNVIFQFELKEEDDAEKLQDQERVVFKVRKIEPPTE